MKEEIYQYNCIICGNNQCIKVYKEAPDLAKKEAQEEVSYCKNCSNLLNNKAKSRCVSVKAYYPPNKHRI